MKRKELKNLAKRIAGYEVIIQTNENKDLVDDAKEEIMRLTSKVSSLEDLELLDSLILEILDN